ncbi:AtaL-like protein [Flavobacterium sp.]|jgi:ribosome-associated toxin RatA of RatAB toxin-antitoxin module|uniref:AtaL-like protein n=1 Tax=Flavobacterium sp. TaxID=239 RepID=UPI0033404023
MVQYTTTVKATLEKVWQHLILKIENPENFVPGISDVFILEKNDDFVIRKMTVTTPDNTTTLTEKITFIPYKVRFLLVEHPKFEGYVDNDIKPILENETEITFTINWKDKTTQTEINNFELVKNAVEKTKSYIEENL